MSARTATVGHAFGQRVARLTATDHPDVVVNIVLRAATRSRGEAAGHALLPEQPVILADVIIGWLRTRTAQSAANT